MSREMKKEVLSAREWMDYYEKLFKEKKPVKASPLLLKGAKEDTATREARRNQL